MMIQAGESIFFDTNILLIATDESRRGHKTAKSLLMSLLKEGVNICLSGQVAREYLVVASRPAQVNGLGLSSGHAVHNIEAIKERALFLEETGFTSELLQHMVVQHKLKGKRIHDANIIATMRTHRITYLLTENPADFECFEHVKLIRLEDMKKSGL